MYERKDFKPHVDKIIRWIDNYFATLDNRNVKSIVNPRDIYNALPNEAPEDDESIEAILKDLDEIIMPGVTHWQHPGFHAYFPANSSVESLFAEFVTSAIAAQCMIWDTSPAAAELEERVLNWMRDIMGLPSGWEGVIQDTASTATLAAIITAREIKTGFESNKNGVPSNLRVYCSDETHSSIEKAVAIAGIGTRNLVKIECDDQQRMRPELLLLAIQSDIAEGHVPCCVISTLGTTSTLGIDPIGEIGKICKDLNIWHHVDAAYAGTALVLPEYQWMIEGIEHVDSFVFNPHKWMFTNFDCSVYFVRDASSLIETFQVLPEYLKTKNRGQVNDYRDWGIPLGRRFRALKLWFVLRGMGMKGIREKIRKHIALAEYFTNEIREIPGIEICSGPVLNFCTFRLALPGVDLEQLNELNKEILTKLNERGRIYVSHTKIKDKYVIRMVIGQTYVEKAHIDSALDEIKEVVRNQV
jgi:aromatic-L-amino-acid decarboxylase